MKLRPEDKFLAAALSVIAVGAAAGYIAIIAPTYEAENRIPPPPERILSAPPAEEAAVYTLEAGPEPEAPPETEAPVPETEPPITQTEAPAPETEPPIEETEAPAPEILPPAPETEAPPPETEAPPPETEPPEILTLELEPGGEDLPEVSRGIPALSDLLDPAGYYVVNTDSGVIHEPGCYHLEKLKDQNRSGTDRPEELIEAYPETYRWCKDCHS